MHSDLKKIADEYIEHEIEHFFDDISSSDFKIKLWKGYQKFEIINNLKDQCLNFCIEKDKNQSELKNELRNTLNFIKDLSKALQSESVTHFIKAYRNEPDKKRTESKEYLAQLCEELQFIWKRRDPLEALNGNSNHFFSFDNWFKRGVPAYCNPPILLLFNKYITSEYMTHSVLDYIFIDSAITSELCLYGLEIKKNICSLSDIPVDEDYQYCDVSLKDLHALRRKQILSSFFEGLTLGVLLPSIGLSLPFINFFSSKEWLRYFVNGLFFFSSLVIGAVLFSFSVSLTRILIYSIIKKFRKDKRLQLWHEMNFVWKRLGKKIISPLQLLELLKQTEIKGAAWPSQAWCLVDQMTTKTRIHLFPLNRTSEVTDWSLCENDGFTLIKEIKNQTPLHSKFDTRRACKTIFDSETLWHIAIFSIFYHYCFYLLLAGKIRL
jgi:hypothetical protein